VNHTPPHDLGTERAVLASVLLDNDTIDEVLDALEPSDFYARSNGLCFEAMVDLRRTEKPIDMLTVRAWLTDRGHLEKAGGDEGLVALGETLPSAGAIESYGRRVRELASIRGVIRAAQDVLSKAYAPIEDATAFATDAEATITTAARARVETTGPISMKSAVLEVIQDLQRPAEDETGRPLSTGFKRIDKQLGGGMRPCELFLIAGRPGMGKTAIGLDVALALGSQGPGIVFSLEMGMAELVRRALASEGRVDGGRIRTREVKHDWPAIMQAASSLSKLAVHIDATAQATLPHVRSVCRRQKAREGLAWIVIDYLQLMGTPGRDQREQEIGAISRGLKALAKELEIPVLALAQLNRDVEKRPVRDRRPQLSDLRDSGSLEQDADCVAFIHRQELYEPKDVKLRGIAELIIRKQRSGPTGTIIMRYQREHTRFVEITEDDEAELAAETEERERFVAGEPRSQIAGGGYTRSYDPEDFTDA
jgi:replicative DNA helicase